MPRPRPRPRPLRPAQAVRRRYPCGHHLAAPVGAGCRAQADERRRVLAGEPEALVGQAVPHGADVLVALLEPDLEVCVAAVAGKAVVQPVGGQVAGRLAVWRLGVVMGQPGVVGPEEAADVGLLLLGRERRELICQEARLVAVDVEQQRRVCRRRGQRPQLDNFLRPPAGIALVRVVRGEPLAEAVQLPPALVGSKPEGLGEADVYLGACVSERARPLSSGRCEGARTFSRHP